MDDSSEKAAWPLKPWLAWTRREPLRFLAGLRNPFDFIVERSIGHAIESRR